MVVIFPFRRTTDRKVDSLILSCGYFLCIISREIKKIATFSTSLSASAQEINGLFCCLVTFKSFYVPFFKSVAKLVAKCS